MNIIERELTITYDNVKSVSASDKVSLGVAATAFAPAVAYRIYTSHTKSEYYAYLTQGGLDLLFPSDTAKPFKADAGVVTASRFAGSTSYKNQMWAYLNGTTTTALNVTTSNQDKIDYGITSGVAGTTKSQADFRVYLKHSSGAVAVGGNAYFKLYFYQYRCSANAVGNGIVSATVDKTECYDGDTVTFTLKLVNGATWDGWYSDAECTNLVSTSQSCSVIPSSDITLYAKATIDATVYRCSAVAGENIANASVSDESVVSGESTTFTATLNEYCTFDGWFSDSGCTSLVSTENPYTAVITSDTTLYAKGTKISYSISVGTAEHGVATVSTNTAHYGDSVAFTFTPEDDTWELYGWYSDKGLTQLVSESNPYTFTATEDVTLYPKVGKKRYEIKIKCANNMDVSYATVLRIASADTEKFTLKDWENFRSGEYLNINSEAMWCYSEKNISRWGSGEVSIFAPLDSSVSMYSYHIDFDQNANISCFTENGSVVSYGNVYIFTVSSSRTFGVDLCAKCICSAISSDGVGYSYAFPEKACQERYAEFVAEPSSGYAFLGWYSDESCTQLVSSDNPAQVLTPSSGASGLTTTLTLYAKAVPAATVGTGLYMKSNGTYVEVKAAYKKANGVYVKQTDISGLLDENSIYVKAN